MPLVSRTFDQLIDFTRTSAGTFVGSNGLIQSTPASRNLLTFTQEFDNAAWSKNNTSVTANAATAPDGTLTADKLTETATTAVHNVGLNSTTSAVAYTFSCYVKAAERNFALLYHTQSNASIVVNLTTGATGTASGTVAPTSSSVASVGNGWWRVTMTVTATAASNFFGVYLATSLTGSASYAGDGTSGVFIWGAQLEVGSTATDYTRNFGGLFPPRFDFDPVTLAPRGLLVEEQRTNLALWASDFTNAAWVKTNVTASLTATGPDGVTNSASILTASAANGTALQTITSASAARATSCYVKRRTGVGTIEMTQNGGTNWAAVTVTANWTRVEIASATITNPQVGFRIVTSGDAIDVALFQCETGAFATSAIPTVASQVTRTADVATINAPNFAPWYRADEGTFVIEANSAQAGVFNAVFDAQDGTNQERIVQYLGSQTNFSVVDGNVSQANINSGATAANAVAKVASAYRVNDFASSRNGAAVVTDTSGAIPTLDRIVLGSRLGVDEHLNGHIRSIRYYPVRLSNAQLQALTA